MTRRAVALAAVAALATGTLALGVAAPASAVGLVDYRAYQQTLPASVIDGGTLTDDEKIAWTNGTRAGVVSTPVAPISSVPTRSRGTLPGIFGGVGMLLTVAGQQSAELSFSDDLWWKEADRPDWIPQEEWDACSGGGDASNFFDGLNDWIQTFNDVGVGESGMDCAAIREDWLLPRNPDYEPIGASTGISGYPVTVSNTTFGVVGQLLQPAWSDAPTARATDAATRVEGWVIPVNITQGAENTPLSITLRWYDSTGALTSNSHSVNAASGVSPVAASRPAVCATVDYCIVLDYIGYTNRPSNVAMANLTQASWYGTQSVSVQPLPYINPENGSTYSPGLARQVLLTSVRTEAGNLYQCRTVSFVETAPTIPRPCEPEVPDWEIITERTVEVVPETDTGYIPGSNPTRGIQTTTVPEVVRDWQREHPGCDETLCLLDLELEGVGSCFDNPEACEGWYQRADKSAVMRCTYGGTLVDLSQCVKYARLFQPNAITTGTPYPQPSAPNPAQTPTSQTGTVPNTATPPGSQAASPSQPRNCWPEGWGVLNPFEWVYKPVRCVLEWAFVPRNEVVQGMIRGMQAKWAASSLVSLLGVLEQGSDLVLGGSGCAGPTVSVNVFGGAYTGNPLSACAEPMAGVATFSRWFTFAAAWVMAIASIARSIAGVVGFTKLGGDS